MRALFRRAVRKPRMCAWMRTNCERRQAILFFTKRAETVLSGTREKLFSAYV